MYACTKHYAQSLHHSYIFLPIFLIFILFITSLKRLYPAAGRSDGNRGGGEGGGGVGAAIGGVIAALIVVAVVAVLVIAFIWWRRR